MRKILTLILSLITLLLSFGFASCGEPEGEVDKGNNVEPYIIAKVSPGAGRNQFSAHYYCTGRLGANVIFKCETPELEGWYITYSCDNVDKIHLNEEDGTYEGYKAGICYITVTYTNGVDKVTDMVCCYYGNFNEDIDVFFRSDPGLDKGDYMSLNWQLTSGKSVVLEPLLIYYNRSFDDAIIKSVTIEDNSILSYEDGVLTALSAGTTKIVIDCTWRGYTYKSWGAGSSSSGSGSADLRREITVTVS